MSFTLTPGNTDDQAVVEKLTQYLTDLLFGNRGYISKKLTTTLSNQGIEIITRLKKNMKNKPLAAFKQLLLAGRGLIETLSHSISVFLGNGDGAFKPVVFYSVGSNPHCIVASDFNNDGIADLTNANLYSNSVSVLLGNGDGAFLITRYHMVLAQALSKLELST